MNFASLNIVRSIVSMETQARFPLWPRMVRLRAVVALLTILKELARRVGADVAVLDCVGLAAGFVVRFDSGASSLFSVHFY
jgi:hypothetical protein